VGDATIGDEQLLAALAEAARLADPPPASVVAAARASYTWRTIDAELAALEIDSAMEEQSAGLRAGTEDLRLLVFTAAGVSVELGVGTDRVEGQLVPPSPATVEVRTPHGVVQTVQANELGCFTIAPPPASLLSLHCRTSGGTTVVTEWIRV
jgi:hypothetical protein